LWWGCRKKNRVPKVLVGGGIQKVLFRLKKKHSNRAGRRLNFGSFFLKNAHSNFSGRERDVDIFYF
jgi:hypothetical protein